MLKQRLVHYAHMPNYIKLQLAILPNMVGCQFLLCHRSDIKERLEGLNELRWPSAVDTQPLAVLIPGVIHSSPTT